MSLRSLARTIACCALALAADVASAQSRRLAEPRVADSNHVQLLRTRDGSTLVGRVVEVGPDSVRFQTGHGVLTIARTAIAELRETPTSTIKAGVYWPSDPSASRLFFAPTGRMLPEGDGYFSDHYLFFLGSTHGVTNRLTLGGGMSVFPFDDFSDNVFYFVPKVGLVASDNFNVAAGALVAHAGLLDEDSEGTSFGIAYGVATVGGPGASLTVGTGLGYMDGRWAEEPVVMLGAHARLSRRAALLTENYFLPGGDGPLISYGLRFFGEKVSVDLAFFNIVGENAVFPGIPFVGFSVHY